MSIRTLFALSTCGFALGASPALAQATIPYETGEYEYAQGRPELDDDVVTETVTEEIVLEETMEPRGATRVIPRRQSQTAPVFVSRPVIQPNSGEAPVAYDRPATATVRAAPASASLPAYYPYSVAPAQAPVVYAYPAPPAYAQSSGDAARVLYRDAVPPAPVVHGSPYAEAPTYLPPGGQVVAFDRQAWLDECRARLDTYESDGDRAQAIGALVGAAAGGLLGNRIAGGGNRTAGTLIGAGTGALAGMAVGDAVEDRGHRTTDSYGYCERYLDDYMREATATAGRTYYTQPGQYILVPVTVMVPQRAVYRDGTPVE